MSTYREKENYCLRSFGENGPYWHLCTSGKETPLMFRSHDDFVFAMNVVAQMALEYQDVRILTFEIMGNHIHILAEGQSERLLTAFSFIKKRLSRGMKSGFPDGLPEGFSPTLKEIADIDAIRNTIVYINRNGFVSNHNYTPYSYPWGAGPYFFGYMLETTSTFHDVTTKQGRSMFRGRIPEIPDNWPVVDGYVLPISYCAIKFAKALFRLDLARTLHYDFRCSNGQLRRVIGLTQYEVDALFPKSATSSLCNNEIII